MTIEQIVGARIRALRKRNGLTQEDLAERAGMAPQTISRAERGGVLSIANIKRVAKALEVHPLDFFADPGIESSVTGDVRRVVELMQSVGPAVQQAIRQHAEITARLVSESAEGVGRVSAGGGPR